MGWLAALLLLILGAVPAGASATTWYTVEIVVFALASPDPSSEIWPAEPGRPDLAGSIELGTGSDPPDDGTPFAFRRLAADRLMLQEEAARLRGSNQYRPLLHVGWRQPGFARGEARAVHIGSADGAGVDGVVRVWRERFLHVEVDLVYGLRREAGSRSYFRLREQRRMRSREVHFLDHPMFGILITAAPFEVGRTAPDSSSSEGSSPAEPAFPDRGLATPGPAEGTGARPR